MKKLTTIILAVFLSSNVLAQVDFTVSAPYTSPSRNTCGAVNNCFNLNSEEHVYEVTIPTNGSWTFSLCGGSTYDTWLEIGSSACANDFGSIDDYCGLQSELTLTINAGTYFVSVEGFSSN